MVNVTDGTDVYVGFVSLKFCFSHDNLLIPPFRGITLRAADFNL